MYRNSEYCVGVFFFVGEKCLEKPNLRINNIRWHNSLRLPNEIQSQPKNYHNKLY